MKEWFRKFQRGYPTHLPNPQPHPALQHLQVTFQPDEYLEILQKWERYDPPEGYLERLPTYIIARCPICGNEYKTLLNTHSLRDWYGQPPDSRANGIGWEIDGQNGCVHFLAIHYFINLNGLFPEERKRYFRNDYDVPFVSPLFMPDEVPSYAVMHSLPICRLEDGKFVPRYYLYTLTYYVPENYVSWEKIRSVADRIRHGVIAERRAAEHSLEWENFLYYPFQARQHPEWWDLPLWVKKGKLLWLDPHSPNLELRNGPVEDFPYANIQGYRRAIEIRDGKFRFID